MCALGARSQDNAGHRILSQYRGCARKVQEPTVALGTCDNPASPADTITIRDAIIEDTLDRVSDAMQAAG